ncbi:MAG: Gfo/Idh/MocA family oxidoreductase [Planctomycetes bacterium]|nr:Gfo/Idh/MocA family oxidoreductase [Planctomycetota bacterium]
MSRASHASPHSRRTFLKQSTAAAIGGTLAATMGAARMAHAGGSDILRVGLVGCGGRGNGAAVNAMNAEENVRLTALADLFPDKVEAAMNQLSTMLGDKFQVTKDRCFVGFDAYKQLINADVDVVLLCTSPHYRPVQLRAAIEAGKHVFTEKPVAVDPVGVRSILESSELATQKGLNIVSGLCWRYDFGVRETIGRIKQGAIGDILAIHENYLTGELKHAGRKPQWSEMEYQNRNWMYFTWLSGDHICEQFVHSLDKAMWVMDEQPPESAFGLGGRQKRTDPMWGHIYDHHAVCYQWSNGVKVFAYTRQMNGCHNDVDDYVIGTKGRAQVLINQQAGLINGEPVFRGKKPSMYDQEHVELFEAIRKGTPINDGRYTALSTMLAILGREACYTGQQITWDAMMKSNTRLGPETYEWGDVPAGIVPVPGITKFA